MENGSFLIDNPLQEPSAQGSQELKKQEVSFMYTESLLHFIHNPTNTF